MCEHVVFDAPRVVTNALLCSALLCSSPFPGPSMAVLAAMAAVMWSLLGRRTCAFPPLRPCRGLLSSGLHLRLLLLLFPTSRLFNSTCCDGCPWWLVPPGWRQPYGNCTPVLVLRPGVAGKRETHPIETRQKHAREREREREREIFL